MADLDELVTLAIY